MRYSKTNRSNHEWVTSLRGDLGHKAQQESFSELASYLYIVIGNQLQNRRTTLPRLATLHNDEIDNLTQDFLQSFMLKMTQNNFAMLSKFSGTGRFLAWAAQIANNLVASEFRRVEWLNQGLADENGYVDTESATPEAAALCADITDVIHTALASLPEHYEQALRRCIMNGDGAKEVAKDLKITQNAVHILVYRAKKALLLQLGKHGIGPESLTLFAW